MTANGRGRRNTPGMGSPRTATGPTGLALRRMVDGEIPSRRRIAATRDRLPEKSILAPSRNTPKRKVCPSCALLRYRVAELERALAADVGAVLADLPRYVDVLSQRQQVVVTTLEVVTDVIRALRRAP